MRDLSVIIPARNEEFLPNTIENILANIEADTEIIAVLDGYWPESGIPQHDRVMLVHNHKPIGQRAAVNQGAKISTAKYVMKLDAHCSVDRGFDRKLMEDCEYDWTVIPRMYNLHAFDWKCESCGHRVYQGKYPEACESCKKSDGFEKVIVWAPRRRRRADFMRFDNNMKFQYWRAYGRRREAKGKISDLLSAIGACFFMHRQRFYDLGMMDEEHGSWGQFGTEISCKSWLSGGRQVVNKKTWFSHMFRTGKGFGFPYKISNKQVSKARRHSKGLWLGNTWPLAVRDIGWLIDKFSPVPDWEDFKSADKPIAKSNGAKKGMVYYTDNHGDQFLLDTCRKQIVRCSDEYGLPIVSISQLPIVDFGKNIVVDLKRAVLSIFKQILLGCEESTAKYIFLLEHDMLYHPSHFDFTPPNDNIFYYDRNRWSVCDETGKSVFYHTNVPSMLCADRELLIQHYSKVVEWVERDGWRGSYGYSPPKGLPSSERSGKYKTYFSEFPTLDIRRSDSWSRKRMDKDQFRSHRSRRGWEEADEVPGWGAIKGRFDSFLMGVSNG